jgi:hypothetical protein
MKIEVEVPDGLSPLGQDLIQRFARALAVKMASKQEQYGNSWRVYNWRAECQAQLQRHVYKGDPIDVGLYSAFCFHHSWPTVPVTMRPIA